VGFYTLGAVLDSPALMGETSMSKRKAIAMTETPGSQPTPQPQPEQPAPAEPAAAAPAPAAPQGKAMITYDDFVKLDLRVGKIIEVKDHPNADKLLCLTVDLGTETRQIIAGIRGQYSHEAMLGREVIVVANLLPRKMRGLESQGMMLAASAGEGDARMVVFLTPERELPPGSPVS
jgi:methionine--tRNA ligase beta chain